MSLQDFGIESSSAIDGVPPPEGNTWCANMHKTGCTNLSHPPSKYCKPCQDAKKALAIVVRPEYLN